METIDLSIKVPDKATVQRAIDGIAYRYNYQDKVPDTEAENPLTMKDNPETKTQFAKRMLRQWVRDCMKSYEVNKAMGDASDAKTAEINAITIE